MLYVLKAFGGWKLNQKVLECKNTKDVSSDISNEDKEEERRNQFKVIYPKNCGDVIGLEKAKLALDAAIKAPRLFPGKDSSRNGQNSTILIFQNLQQVEI